MHVVRLLAGLDVVGGVGEIDFENVVALDDRVLDRESVADEHVFRLGDDLAVEADGGEGIEAVSDEFQHIVSKLLRREGKLGLVAPVLVGDPLEVPLIGTPEGIGNQLVVEQIGMDAAGHAGFQIRFGFGFEKEPVGEGEFGEGLHGKDGNR